MPRLYIYIFTAETAEVVDELAKDPGELREFYTNWVYNKSETYGR